MMHYAVPGGDVYLAASPCGCNPDEARRPHQCTNACTSWVRLVPWDASEAPPWIRVRYGAGIHQCSTGRSRLEDITEYVRTIQA